MATLVHICGFEEGGYSDGPYGAGVHDYSDSGNADYLTWDTVVRRNGQYALKAAPTGTSTTARLRWNHTSTQHSIHSFWFRWNTLDVAHDFVATSSGAALQISTAGVVSATADGTAFTSGGTIAADTWANVEFYYNTSANPRVLKWRVGGTAYTDVSYAAAATTTTSVDVKMVSSTTGSIVWFDDWIASHTGADYPLGPAAVESLYPTGDGTHNQQSFFEDESNVDASGSSTYLKVQPSNFANYWQQADSSGTAYLEWTLPDTTRTNPIFGAEASVGVRKNGAIGNTTAAVKLYTNGTAADIYSDSIWPWGAGDWFGKSALFLTANGTAWTPTLVNSTTIRFGYGSDAYPEPEIEMAVLEVAFDDDPDETGGGGDPGDPDPEPEPTHVPGIWVDWDGNGTWVEETSRVISMNWSRGASFDHVNSAGPGNATIIVQNSDGRFNPDNSGGTLYGKLLPQRPVWGGAIRTTGALTGGSAADVRGFFGGYITEIVPTPVPGANPTAELICEDALGWYRRATATVSPVRDIGRGQFRQSVLTSIGEDVDRRDLESEPDTMPFAAADARDALGVLEELNRADSARHFIAPADFKERTYYYTAVNRLHKLTAPADEVWNADDITQLAGYRVTSDNIVNLQRATVSPINFSSNNEIVWTASPLPMAVSTAQPVTLWPEFADYVFDAAVSVNTTGGTLTTTLTNFGTSAKLELVATGSLVNITSLDVTGSSLRRGDLQTVRSEDDTSQSVYGIRSGGDVSTDYIGQPGAAKAVTDYLVWKFADPLKRPTVTIAGKGTATMTSILERDLFDVVTLTVDRLNVSAKRFEIIGLRGQLTVKAANVPHYEVSYELQETAIGSAITDYWVWDESSWNGTDVWAPF